MKHKHFKPFIYADLCTLFELVNSVKRCVLQPIGLTAKTFMPAILILIKIAVNNKKFFKQKPSLIRRFLLCCCIYMYVKTPIYSIKRGAKKFFQKKRKKVLTKGRWCGNIIGHPKKRVSETPVKRRTDLEN